MEEQRSINSFAERLMVMCERMLDKKVVPTIQEMTEYCGKNEKLFTSLNNWLSKTYGTVPKIVFPYGNNYGWCTSHMKKGRLICNIFPEKNTFTVMIKLSNKQFDMIYNHGEKYEKEMINNKCLFDDRIWIYYRVTCNQDLDDIEEMLTIIE